MNTLLSKSSGGAVNGLAGLAIVVALLSGSSSRLSAGGFDDAIESAIRCSVKLYGLGAGQHEGYGTGILVSWEGHVLTVSSLLIDARKIRAVTADGKKYEARVERRDSDLELALLKLVVHSEHGDHATATNIDPFPFFDLAGTRPIEPGDWVVSAGNSFKIADGAEPVSINHGVFAIRTKMDARRGVREFPYRGDVLVIDAITSNPGAPGSGVVNLDGLLIGMVGRSVTSNLTHTHLNYAMPLEVLHEFVVRAQEDNQAEPVAATGPSATQDVAWDPGIRVVRTGYQKLLPFVDRVTSGSPADLAGIRKDDLILSINGKSVPDVDTFDRRVKMASSKGFMDVVIRRGAASRTSIWNEANYMKTDWTMKAQTQAIMVATVMASASFLSAGYSLAADPDKMLVRSTQAAFRSVAMQMKPYVVRIDTVGGSQPTGAPASAGAESVDGSEHPSQSPFQDTPGSDFELADGPTTGLIWSSDGLIITSSFNFVRQPLLITVTFSNGSRKAADVVARDQVRKIALLKVDASNLPVPTWVPQEELAVGQWAIALGRGYGGDAQAVGVGIVSALNRMSGFAVQTDAKLSTANYGGPLCDIRGRVIGLCAPMALRPGELAGIRMYDAGVGFVVPKHRLDEIVPDLVAGRSSYRGWLGVSVDPHTKEFVSISNVASPSPMEEAGVLPGDRITFAAGRVIRHYGDLTRALSMISAGEEIDVRLERDGGEFQVIVPLARSSELGALPDAPEPLDPSEPATEPEPEQDEN